MLAYAHWESRIDPIFGGIVSGVTAAVAIVIVAISFLFARRQ